MDDRIDHDLLERYLLGRVTPDERMAVEENLRTDETWRIAIMEERRLAAVVRRAGRDDVKARLRSRVATPARRVPWVRPASIAAMLVTAVGIAVLLRQPSVMDLPSGQTPPIASDMDVADKAEPAVTGDGKSAKDAGTERGAEAGTAPAPPAESGSRRERPPFSFAIRINSARASLGSADPPLLFRAPVAAPTTTRSPAGAATTRCRCCHLVSCCSRPRSRSAGASVGDTPPRRHRSSS